MQPPSPVSDQQSHRIKLMLAAQCQEPVCFLDVRHKHQTMRTATKTLTTLTCLAHIVYTDQIITPCQGKCLIKIVIAQK